MILAGRRLNDGMGAYVVSQLVKKMLKQSIQVEGANVLVMGFTFKENCPDLRNTKVVDIVSELKEYNINVDITDPWCSSEEAEYEYGLSLITTEKNLSDNKYDAIILAVAHDEFKHLGAENIRKLGKENHVLYDLKYLLPKNTVDMRL
jgi:UDP-N-acetyl-D-galactosamine dehydrogenase